MKEKRKIIKISDRNYQLLKPRKDRSGWHDYGQNKSIKAISDLLLSNRFELYFSDTIIYEIGRYRQEQIKRSEKYLSKKMLEAKTI